LNPPFIILAAERSEHTRVVRRIFENISADKIVTTIELAELLKYSCNSFHALKVAFTNEISAICQNLGVDVDELMRIFALDRKLNISPYYLTAGFAFGGSCLPKDLKALNRLGELNKINLPVLQSIEKSNEALIKKAIHLIEAESSKKIGFLGITFKAGTSDLRGSPALKVMLELNSHCKIKFFDPNITESELENTNGEISKMTLRLLKENRLETARDLIANCEVIVVATKEKSFLPYLRKETHKKILDLANIEGLKSKKNYVGLNW
jgi:GDP-mannose 6-dehydrogenase